VFHAKFGTQVQIFQYIKTVQLLVRLDRRAVKLELPDIAYPSSTGASICAVFTDDAVPIGDGNKLV